MENPAPAAKKDRKFGTWALVAAIVIVLNLFFNYAISLVYPAPSYDAYFPTSQVVQPIADQADCVAAGGQWTAAEPAVAPEPGSTSSLGSCDPNYTKEQQYAAAETAYGRNVFIILVVLGVASLILAALIGNAVLALAFSWGGVLSLVIASMRYWGQASGIIRVLVLAAALGALIWVAVRKFGSKHS